MLLLNSDFGSPAYSSPACDVCECLGDVIICQSGTIGDWVDDPNYI